MSQQWQLVHLATIASIGGIVGFLLGRQFASESALRMLHQKQQQLEEAHEQVARMQTEVRLILSVTG